MIKYCKSCGKEYSGEYCKNCGYGKPDLEVKAYDKYKVKKPERFMTDEEKEKRAQELKAEREASKQQDSQVVAKRRQAQKKNSQWAFIITAIVVFIGVVLLALYSGGYIFQSADKTDVIKTYFSAIENNDFDGYLGTMVEPMADQYRESAKELGISDSDAMKELYSDYIEGFGENYTITLKFGNEEKVDDGVISQSESTLKSAYGKSFDIKEAYKVAVNVVFKGDKAEETQDMYVFVGKIGRKWYILNIDN